MSLLETAKQIVREASANAGRVSWEAVNDLARAIRDEETRKKIEIRSRADLESAQ